MAILAALIFIACPMPGFAQNISSAELIEKAKDLDGSRVTYKGEAVTAVMKRGAYSWVSVNDGSNAVGVWGENSIVEEIGFIGDYKYKGDTIEVVGIFNRACSAHGGELDIHAEKIVILERGCRSCEKPYGNRIRIAIALFLVTLTVVAVFRRKL